MLSANQKYKSRKSPNNEADYGGEYLQFLYTRLLVKCRFLNSKFNQYSVCSFIEKIAKCLSFFLTFYSFDLCSTTRVGMINHP